jgi:predicted phosphodiesterase
MRYMIISDLHSNLESLEAALQYRAYDRVVVLGDIVGYGANPNEVVDLVRDLNPIAMVRGNHDKVVSGVEDGELFSAHALQAARWSRRQITPGNSAYLKNLAQGPIEVNSLFSIAHGSPLDEDEYLVYEEDAEPQFRGFRTPVCFFGHTHIPVIFALTGESQLLYDFPAGEQSLELDLSGARRYLINPGSVGQPRDGNPLGSFAVFDSDQKTVQFLRYEYPIAVAQKKILQAGLPPFLAQRLSVGR